MIRDEFAELFDDYWAIGAAVWVLVVVLVVAFVLRYRARPDDPDDDARGGPEKKTPVELAYAFLVACVAAFLIYLTFDTMDGPGYAVTAQGIDAGRPPAGAERIDVTAARWRWRFTYAGHGITVTGDTEDPATLTVPVDTPVTLRMTSLDVIHALWIPELRFKQDVFPGRTTTMTVTFPEVATLRRGGACNQFCGLRHAEMDFDVRVLSREDYRAWAAGGGG